MSTKVNFMQQFSFFAESSLKSSIAVYNAVGERDQRAQIRRLAAGLAGFSHLVLHRVHLLHRGFTGIAGGLPAGHQLWEVGEGSRMRLRSAAFL